ncbi:hypothetical protein Adt_28187 [Abeliophyllum distichum]|uniref:Uncharacterized protein n=1 Tax=Abeliophyllum distichum TaxID=126358 RepID=A0ABD1RVV4_9LAMI
MAFPLGTRPPFDKLLLPTEHHLSFMASPTWDSATIRQTSFAYGASPQLLGLFHFRLGHHLTSSFAYRASHQLHVLFHFGLSHHSISSFCLWSITSAARPLLHGTQPPFSKLFLPTEHRLSCMTSPTWNSATIRQALFTYGASPQLHALFHLDLANAFQLDIPLLARLATHINEGFEPYGT